MDSTGATNGNELFRSLPQFGDVAFTEKSSTNQGRNSNAPRGDVSSINLHNVGSVYTLLLVNGRRTVQTRSAPAQLLPTMRMRFPPSVWNAWTCCWTAPAAVYGSDAVAGVVNLVTPGNLDGGGVKLEYGRVQTGHRQDGSLAGYLGNNFADSRGNVAVQYEFSLRTAQLNS